MTAERVVSFQILVYKDDFTSERADRERAQSRVQELEGRLASLRRTAARRQVGAAPLPLPDLQAPPCPAQSRLRYGGGKRHPHPLGVRWWERLARRRDGRGGCPQGPLSPQVARSWAPCWELPFLRVTCLLQGGDPGHPPAQMQ